MRWTVLAIVLFIALYTLVSLFLRKEDAAHLPYEESQVRGGHELREVGWQPFPNAYGIAGEDADLSRLPMDEEQLPATESVPVEVLDRQDERVRAWADRLPPLEQGEQLQRVEAPVVVPPDAPYIARLHWDAPDDFLSPQLVVFRQGHQILIVPRPPARHSPEPVEETVFIVPPDFVEKGDYEVFLSTEGRVNRWTFRAE